MAFGLSPKHIEELQTPDLSIKQCYFIALETAKKLNWEIGILSKSGFLSYTKFSMTSWSEEIQIKVKEGSIEMKSECTGSQLMDWGKNKKNVKSFISTFNELLNEFSTEEAESNYASIESEFVSPEEDLLNKGPLSQKQKLTQFFSLFKPTEDYFITPILIMLNILVFIIMSISGVNIMAPQGESMIEWGANFAPLTLNGEWWRLLSSCFIHFGIFHLLMNMYALLYIGLLLEPYLGKTRFLSAYLLAGIAGSASSIFWNDYTISAGASGAIFGMYGVFLALLTTNHIEKSARKALLTSILVFVGYNLLNGLQGGIDNAAHIGGLVSGLIIGFAFYPSMKRPELINLKFASVGLMSFLILAASFVVLSSTPLNDMASYEKEMKKFTSLEQKALSLYSMPETTTPSELMAEIKNVGIPTWNAIIKLLDKVDEYNLPDEVHAQNALFLEYCRLRIISYEVIYKAIEENSNSYDAEIESLNRKIENIIIQLGGETL